MEEGPKREAGDALENGSCCPGVDSGGFGTVVTIAAAGGHVAVCLLPLSNVLGGLSLISQVGWGR